MSVPSAIGALRIDVWSDVACPWCWVGKRHLEQALDDYGAPAMVRWHAFELDTHAPKSYGEPFDYVARIARKYGTTPDQARMMLDRMTAAGAAVGLPFRFDHIKPGNTFDAHRLLHWAGTGERQNALKERLFELYMTEGRSVADVHTLVSAASDVGLDTDRASAVLLADEYAPQVREDEATAAQLGVTGVPFFVIGERYAVPGAQPPELLLRVLRKCAEEAEPAAPEFEDGAACTPEGC